MISQLPQLPLASLLSGFLASNLTGQIIVLVQIAGSIIAAAIIIGKRRELESIRRANRRFGHEFSSCNDVLDYYTRRRKSSPIALERVYNESCERLMELLSPETRRHLGARNSDQGMGVALSPKEIELVRSTCDNVTEIEESRLGRGMIMLGTIVTISPMLGLLGTVWGVLDAFADMGTQNTVMLATIAPAISAALVTTVVGLLVAIPSAIFNNNLTSKIDNIVSDMHGFADELMSRIALELQG